jgi:endoplasmic reticulum protein 29
MFSRCSAILALAYSVELVQAYNDRGIIKLDNTTFDRIIDGSKNVFVRFDKEYSYGDEHDAFKDFAATVGGSSADALVCDVGVSEYGDKDNSDLAERFSIKTDSFPQFRFWAKGKASSTDPIVFSGDKKKDEFLRFLQEKAGVWIGLPGQVKEMDALAKEFKTSSDKAAVVKKAEAVAAKADDKDAAKYYVKLMTKAAADDSFLTKEVARLKKMVDDGSVKPAKKEQFGRRLNMLSSFS